MYKMNDQSTEEVGEKVTTVDEKVDSIASTWGKLMENEDFRELEEKEQKMIWELIKIRENDGPKNQTEVAEQYGVTDAHLSQLKEKINKLGL
ncbi:hypothetical protein SVXNc_0494 [Candidatus Nanohalococcus occultus]|uniref:Uncharacterized protein n=2 Tax=Candidatus Nanohalococcus occultus TaxID=2978047 RepID=A0ABY8CE75_9ARCH|nr:hypothetical protein SVXNc_0494 [Candidatus Nanohaloarchaeota archaeon SVXNc]